MTAQKCIKCVYIHRMQLKKLRAIIYFSRVNCSHCWNQLAVTCSTFMQQNWQHARFRVPITFPCMFVNFHSEKLRFPMSKCLPLAKDFSGGEMVSDKISWKNPKQLSCDPVTPTSTFYLQSCLSEMPALCGTWERQKLPSIIFNKLSPGRKQLQLSRCTETFQSDKLDLQDPTCQKQGSASKAEIEVKTCQATN